MDHIVSYMITYMISYMISYMMSYHLSNASILDASVTVQELCTRLLDTSLDICSASDRIKLVCPVQLIFRAFAGWTFHGRAECCRRYLQPVQADDVPESLSKTDQLVRPAEVSRCFAQLVDLSNDWIHRTVKHIDTTLRLPALVLVGAR